MPRLPLLFALLALAVEAAQLTWEHLHGGIRVHHFLRSAAMPGFSNAWGLVLLPALAAWAGARIQARLALGERPAAIVAAGALALAAGATIALGFIAGMESITSGVFFGVLLAALLLPVGRAECLLGWVLGMVLIFGPVIPLVTGSGVAGLSALLHRGLKPRVLRWFRR